MALIDRQVEYILSDHIFIVHSVEGEQQEIYFKNAIAMVRRAPY